MTYVVSGNISDEANAPSGNIFLEATRTWEVSRTRMPSGVVLV